MNSKRIQGFANVAAPPRAFHLTLKITASIQSFCQHRVQRLDRVNQAKSRFAIRRRRNRPIWLQRIRPGQSYGAQ
jgi:hypothetical protein